MNEPHRMGVFAINTHIMNESFVYLWRDSLKSRYYLGFHNGSNPSYICSSKHMMKEYKARPQDFKRRILKVGARKEMAVLERELLLKRIKHLNERYYNLMIPRKKGFPILEWTDEMRKRQSITHKGRKPRLGKFGYKHSPETILRMSQPRSAEHKRNMSIAGKGKIFSEEHKRNMSIGMKGKRKVCWTDERKKRASEFYKEWWRLRKLNLQVS